MAWLTQVAWLALGMTIPLSGTVVDEAGKPVVGASVWLGDTIANREGPEVLATAETGEGGRFRLERPADMVGRGRMWSPTLWAYRAGSRVAFLEFKGNLPTADEPVLLALGPPASTALRVLGTEGKPIAGARVRLAQAALTAPRPPDGLRDRLAVTTDADGRATVDGFAPADIVALDVTVPGQIVQCLPIDLETGTVTLRPLGRLKARIVADDPGALSGWSIQIWSRPNLHATGRRGPYTTHWIRETTDADGWVDFPTVAEGEILWNIRAPEGSNYLVRSLGTAVIRAGETQEVAIQVMRAVRVEGTVVEEPGGAPIPGVTIDLNSLTHHNGRVNRMLTDAQGRFSTLVLPGQARFSFGIHAIPRDYFLPPGTPHWADLELKEGQDRQVFTPPRLRKGALVRGRVIDESGAPVVAVDVLGKWTSAEYGTNPNSVRVETDSRGEFVLGNIAPGAEVIVSASSPSLAEAEPVTVERAGEGEPITLRLRRRPTLSLSGRVLGAEGQPLAGARIQVRVRPLDQRFVEGTVAAFEKGQNVLTSSDGRYATPPRLPVGNAYRVEAQAAGFEPARSNWLVEPVKEVPDLVLRKLVGTRMVAGRVVDSAGEPVVGAEVYQSGDGPSRTSGLSGEDGRFRVSGVPNAPAFLFVRARGFRFAARRLAPADISADVSLRRVDEAPATLLKQAETAVPRDEERALARALLDEAWKEGPGDDNGQRRREILEIRALADPERVIAMIENQVVRAESNLLENLALARSEKSAASAVEILDAIGSPYESASIGLRLFDRLGKTAPAGFRRDLLERGEKQARALEDVQVVVRLLAQVGDRWLDLDEAERGTRLVREAQARLGTSREPSYPDPRDALALGLARVDLPRALALLEGRGTEQEYALTQLRVGIVKRIATRDPEEADRILTHLERPAWVLAVRLAGLRMAARDLPAARKLAVKQNAPMIEALLPAIAARARAASDPEGARALLKESVERLGTLADRTEQARPWPSILLARLLPLAVRIDPERAPEYLALALAWRPPLWPVPESAPVISGALQHDRDLAELAALVARYDRDAAEAVFAPVAARLPRMVDEDHGLRNEGPALFQAAGRFDPRAARALLLALPDDPTPPPRVPGRISISDRRHRSKAQARLALAKILALPPALRLNEPATAGEQDEWLEELDD